MDNPQKLNDETVTVESETFPEGKTGLSTQKKQFGIKKHLWLKKGPRTKKEKAYFYISIFAMLFVAGGLILWMNKQVIPDPIDFTMIKKVEVKYFSPLNGLEVGDEAATTRPVIAVMIENSPDARPQSGLAQADVVFEAVAEGGITRFITLYQANRPELIGPVRSLRPYYADWAAGFDPAVAHVGGSPEALSMIRSGNYGVDIDQFFNSGSYWRATNRSAPHNVYTSGEKLEALVGSKGKETSIFEFAPRANEKKVATPTASTISIAVSSGIFSVGYTYDHASNTYARSQGGVAHTDREKGQIAPKVVVALKTNIVLSSDGSHMNISTSGSGAAYVFQNGTVTEGTWSKADAKGQLFIKDATGNEISLVRGQTWITTVGNDRSVSWQ